MLIIKKDILLLGKILTLVVDNTLLTAEVDDRVKIYPFKSGGSDLNTYLVSLANISKQFSINNIQQTGLNGYVIFRLIMEALILMIFFSFINI